MQRIAKMMRGANIESYGVCRFEDATPLLNVRAKSRIPQNAQSIIMMLFGYYTEAFPTRNISRYAIPDDYHTIVLSKLKEISEQLEKQYNTELFIPFVDISPLAEVRAAHLAGLGDIGLNSMLISPLYGTYCFIGEIITTMQLDIQSVYNKRICTKCGACIAACPTGALKHSSFSKELCRSEITQKKGALTEWERAQVQHGGFAWGCDICMDVCPANKNIRQSNVPAFYQNPIPVLTKENLKEAMQTKAIAWRGESVLLRNLDIINENTPQR